MLPLPNPRRKRSSRRPFRLADLPRGELLVSVKDRQGNVTRLERTFSVAAPARR